MQLKPVVVEISAVDRYLRVKDGLNPPSGLEALPLEESTIYLLDVEDMGKAPVYGRGHTEAEKIQLSGRRSHWRNDAEKIRRDLVGAYGTLEDVAVATRLAASGLGKRLMFANASGDVLEPLNGYTYDTITSNFGTRHRRGLSPDELKTLIDAINVTDIKEIDDLEKPKKVGGLFGSFGAYEEDIGVY